MTAFLSASPSLRLPHSRQQGVSIFRLLVTQRSRRVVGSCCCFLRPNRRSSRRYRTNAPNSKINHGPPPSETFLTEPASVDHFVSTAEVRGVVAAATVDVSPFEYPQEVHNILAPSIPVVPANKILDVAATNVETRRSPTRRRTADVRARVHLIGNRQVASVQAECEASFQLKQFRVESLFDLQEHSYGAQLESNVAVHSADRE